MSISTGTQIIAPSGFGPLRSTSIYYFLRSDHKTHEVLLIEFIQRQPRIDKNGKAQTPIPLAVLHKMQKSIFEEAITSTTQTLIVAPRQSTLPPWLAHLEGLDPEALEKMRKGTRNHMVRIEERLATIASAVDRAEEILHSPDPDSALNHIASQQRPQKYGPRFRLWFYTYLVFSRNPFALHYNTGGIGKWNRDSKIGAKRGTPSTYGSGYGVNVDASMRDTIILGYNTHAKLGCSMEDIYRKTMIDQFGCRAISKNSGMLDLHQPQGKPTPSLRQFSYTVNKIMGKLERASDVIGPARVRNELAPSAGTFSESVCNILERVEGDGYFLKELPRGLIEGSPLRKLVVVRLRCVTTGMLFGIGFSLGGETAAAYRMAMFCAAIDKVKFCSLFGIKITASQWPGSGIPPYVIVDRGPASGLTGLSNLEETMPIIRELSPTYAGQSKATIETTNPKTQRNSERPTYVRSKHNAITLVRREILRLIKDNDSIDISARLTPDLINEVRKPSPLALWNELARRGRNDSFVIDFPTAVRSFLEPRKISAKYDGMYLLGRRYDSSALRESELLSRIAAGECIEIMGYVMSACVRHNWIFAEGRLIELDLHLPLRVQNEQHYYPLKDLEDWSHEEKRRKVEFAVHRRAMSQQIEEQFERESGSTWGSATTMKGRAPKGSRSAQVELKESKRDFG